MRKFKWMIVVGLFIIISILSIMYSNQKGLPIYKEINNVKSDTPNFVKHYLIKGNQKYVTDATEFPLETTRYFFGEQIGETVNGERVLKVKGQEPRDYIVLIGFMTPVMVYRNVAIPPVNFYSTKVSEIQLRYNKGVFTSKKKTTDDKIISEVIDSLRKPTYIRNKSEAEYLNISLISPKLDGLRYRVGVVIDKDKNIYLKDVIEEKSIKAGPLFTKWVNER